MICIGIFLMPILLFSQQDLASTEEELLLEQEDINFQTFFFEALKHKVIGNYDKAIFALEECNSIDKENIGVLFELSKNYFLSEKYPEAEYYALKSLEIEPNNIYVLRYLKDINLKQYDYKGAIKVQKKIVAIKQEAVADLVLLYIKSGEIDEAKTLIQKMVDEGALPARLEALKESLLQTKVHEISKNEIYQSKGLDKTEILKQNYQEKKDYSSLKRVLESEFKTKQYQKLLQDSTEGIALYPMQPLMYWMQGVALNSLKKYKEAIETLNLGLDFVVDDLIKEAEFMEQLSVSYKGLGDVKTAAKYNKKAIELRNKK